MNRLGIILVLVLMVCAAMAQTPATKTADTAPAAETKITPASTPDASPAAPAAPATPATPAVKKVKTGKIVLKYANFPPASTFPCVQMERWKTELENRLGSEVEVQTFPGGTLLGPKNMYDGVVSGLADIGCFAMSYQPGRFPLSESVDLPLGFNSSKVASRVLFDLFEKYKPKEFEDVKILTVFTCPPANIMSSKPLQKLADFKGMELRVSGTGADVLKRLGGVPVAMPQSETPDAIQKGVVKGIISSLEILKDFNFFAYCRHVTKEDLNVISFAVVMNKETWDELPNHLKAVIDDMSRAQMEWTADYVDNHVLDALEWCGTQDGEPLKIYEFTPAEKAEIKKLLQPMIDEYAKRIKEKGLPTEEILADVQALKTKYEEQFKKE